MRGVKLLGDLKLLNKHGKVLSLLNRGIVAPSGRKWELEEGPQNPIAIEVALFYLYIFSGWRAANRTGLPRPYFGQIIPIKSTTFCNKKEM